jgi:DNA-binding transcriptional ArsR family regulator
MNEAFKAIADPTRREILRKLRSGDRTAGEIASGFDVSWPTISHHLRVLRQANLIAVERKGQELLYSLNTTVVHELVADFMGMVGQDSDEV